MRALVVDETSGPAAGRDRSAGVTSTEAPSAEVLAYRSWREQTETCPECRGTGIDRRTNGTRNWTWCDRCHGAGRVERELPVPRGDGEEGGANGEVCAAHDVPVPEGVGASGRIGSFQRGGLGVGARAGADAEEAGVTVKKGDVYSRSHTRHTTGYPDFTVRETEFLIVTSVRKGVVYGRRCAHKRQAQYDPGYCEREAYDLDGFVEHLKRWRWKPDTLERESER